jgi:CRISPR-associated protein Cas6/Cse3/CasE subtype I-E
MLLDHTIPKPPTLNGYQLHQMVLGLTDGGNPQFVDMGDKAIIRTENKITDVGVLPRQCATGDIVGFELRACIAKKTKGRRSYYPTKDWRVRHAWLRKQGERFGFEPLTITCHPQHAVIDDKKGRRFTVDQSDFVGVLKVEDETLFNKAIKRGIGSTSKAFGFGMLLL